MKTVKRIFARLWLLILIALSSALSASISIVTEKWTSKRIVLALLPLVVTVALLWHLIYQSHSYLGLKGIFAEILALVAVACTCLDAARPKSKVTEKVNWRFFFVSSALFLACFPFFMFLHATGLVPGLFFLLIFSYLWAGLAERSLPSFVGIFLLALFVWLWGEAGRPGLVVMPVDLPEGRDDMNFTSDGVANALETELKDFGSHEKDYGGNEASRIFSKDFPQSPWFKGTEARPPGLEGLQASHVIVGTDVEGFPLLNVYHILRHLRGTPLLEAQILLGDDRSLTLALRRSNAPLNCMDQSVSGKILRTEVKSVGQAAVEELWNATQAERMSWPKIPDARGCTENLAREALDWLDITHPPAASEERLANVTVHGLSGDERLSTALHLAALGAIQQLSPERLAIYYDTRGKSDSAVYYFKKAIPDLLKEAHEANPSLREYPRQRLANALIRIGDFAETCTEAGSVFELASKLFSDDLNVEARIGYGYLVRHRELEWNKDWSTLKDLPPPDEACQNLIPLSICHLQKAVAAAVPEATRTDCDEQAHPDIDLLIRQLERAVTVANACSQKKDKALPRGHGPTNSITAAVGAGQDKCPELRTASVSRLGLSRWKETLAWAGSNLAYALALRSPENLLQLENVAKAAANLNSKDPRPAITKEYLAALYTFFDGRKCPGLTYELKKIDPLAPGELWQNPYKAQSFTLHNTLLMEEQLEEIYADLTNNCAETFAETFKDNTLKGRPQRAEYHHALFGSLFTLNLVQSRVPHPENLFADFRTNVGTMEKMGEGLPERARLQQLFLATVRSDKTDELCNARSHPQSTQDEPVGQDATRVQSLCANLQFSCKDGATQLMKAQKAVNNIPGDYFLWQTLGIIQLRQGIFDKAFVSFQQAVRLNPQEPRSRYLLNFALAGNNRPEAALDQWDYAQLLDPEGWQAGRYSENLSLGTCASAPIYMPPQDSGPEEHFPKKSAHEDKAKSKRPKK